ncbi:MAG: hypothetical protein HYV32_01055 [Candidatus Kerfeldbacteria bacterium]|nr:hypothetical protein [Candidatus Kerfeldbacteria bacterium]
MLKKHLLQLNFTSNQADIYVALLELGQTKIGPLLQKTGFHRNIAYRALDDLISRKLVTKITKRGVAYFHALDPHPLLDELQQQEDVAKLAIKEITSKKQVSYSESLVLSGREGIRDVVEMIIREGADVYLIGSIMNLPRALGKERDYFQKRIEKRGIKHFALLQPHIQNEPDFSIFADARYLPNNFPPSPLVIWIFGNVVAHVLWEEPETIFVIRNKKLAENYRQYFQILWKQSDKIDL